MTTPLPTAGFSSGLLPCSGSQRHGQHQAPCGGFRALSLRPRPTRLISPLSLPLTEPPPGSLAIWRRLMSGWCPMGTPSFVPRHWSAALLSGMCFCLTLGRLILLMSLLWPISSALPASQLCLFARETQLRPGLRAGQTVGPRRLPEACSRPASWTPSPPRTSSRPRLCPLPLRLGCSQALRGPGHHSGPRGCSVDASLGAGMLHPCWSQRSSLAEATPPASSRPCTATVSPQRGGRGSHTQEALPSSPGDFCRVRGPPTPSSSRMGVKGATGVPGN